MSLILLNLPGLTAFGLDGFTYWPRMLVLYSITIFISAFLLFLVQPMVGKMVLPLYGGTPAVWNSCMVFFQAVLLLGYAYVHYSIQRLGFRRQLFLHIALLLLPLVFLPISIEQEIPPQDAEPVVWLITRLTIAVGLPFLVVSCGAPILQRWFSLTGHPSAKDPYFLYASSNTGSLLALLAYPLLLEPSFGLLDQSNLWALGYCLLVFLTACCLIKLRSKLPEAETSRPELHTPLQRLSWRTRSTWVFAAFVPSSLMLGVTAYISTNIAAFPMLWVVPLALYLLTFALVFSRRQLIPHKILVRSVPFLVLIFAPLIFVTLGGVKSPLIPIHLFMFFLIAMVCHGELARRRPDVQHLTDFYLCMSIGGVLGGVFNTIIAPMLFDRIIEYAFAIFLACLILPDEYDRHSKGLKIKNDVIAISAFAMICIGLLTVIQVYEIEKLSVLFLWVFVPLALLCFSFKGHTIRFAIAYGIMLLAIAGYLEQSVGELKHVSRNFFGTKRVIASQNGDMHQLMHGTTLHGIQMREEGKQNIPLAFYHRSGPLGDVFTILEEHQPLGDIAVVGLGAGAIASYVVSGQQLDFYEIDPSIKQIANDERLFTYLSNTKGQVEVILGDGRLTLSKSAHQNYSLLVLDAFSSDAIPIHLLTKEALELYLQKIKPEGVLAFHISNRFLNLEPVLAKLADELGLIGYVRDDRLNSQPVNPRGKFASKYIVMGYRNSVVERLRQHPDWHEAKPGDGVKVWTDQYSNVLDLLDL